MWATVLNHGGGAAQAIGYSACFVPGKYTDLAGIDEAWIRSRSDAVALYLDGTFGSLGASLERTRLLIPWDRVPPMQVGSEASVVVFFSYTTVTGVERSNVGSSGMRITPPPASPSRPQTP